MGFDIATVVGSSQQALHGIGEAVSDAASEALDFATGEDSDTADRVDQLTDEYDRETDARTSREDVDRARTGETASADSVVVPEAFDGMSHPEMFAYSTELTPELLDSAAVMWREAHARMTTAVWALWNDLGAVLGTDWQGAAADTALASVTGYRTESLRTLDLMDIVAGKLEQSRDGFALTRATMPAPQSFTVSDWARTAVSTALLGPVGAAGSIHAMMAEEEERRAQAVAVMNGTYVPTVVRADHGVPVLPPPTDPASGTASSSIGGPGGSGSAAFAAGSPSASSGSPAAFAGPDSVRATASPGDVPSDAADAVPADTTAASTDGPTTAAQSTPPAPGPSSSPGAGAPGTGPGSSGVVAAPTSAAGAGRAVGSAGRGQTGGRTGSSAAPLSRPSGRPSAFGGTGSDSRILQSASGGGTGGGRAAGYGPGGMMPGSRAGGDQDSEHRTAGYLVTADNGDDLVGELPLVAPPVIG